MNELNVVKLIEECADRIVSVLAQLQSTDDGGAGLTHNLTAKRDKEFALKFQCTDSFL